MKKSGHCHSCRSSRFPGYQELQVFWKQDVPFRTPYPAPPVAMASNLVSLASPASNAALVRSETPNPNTNVMRNLGFCIQTELPLFCLGRVLLTWLSGNTISPKQLNRKRAQLGISKNQEP